ncbi:carbon-nitrogen hydrolase family protein [Collinsella sp. An2]|uniref:carbon-nitrogen hydrolase family protein n=1 Tax=Collinsella sp. An2 TaxID=1965585 RepID=UPI000B3ADC8B|nr:carbon-nitrogen hydrolase family protein [Collinsella sp. An2]OUP11088.1 nitrilase [Collinsella sp. An2]
MSAYPKLKVAAVQMAPVMLDLDATVYKVCGFIREAGEAGAKVIGFPEAIVPGYPWWIWMKNPGDGMKHYVDLYRNSVEIPSHAVRKLSDAAREAGAYACVSVTEKEDASLYLTQLWFDPQGNLVGKHRKMKATNAEMTIWGDGDGCMMPVLDTEYGRLGGLQCWEHYIPLNIATMAAQNEQIHVSSWPIGLPDPTHPFAVQQCKNAADYYALTNGCFVLQASQIWTEEQADRLCDTPEQRAMMGFGHGFTRILGPNGCVLSELAHDEEGVCYADIDLADIIPVKYFIDTAGHYSTPGVMQLYVDMSEHKAVHLNGKPEPKTMSYEEIQELDA